MIQEQYNYFKDCGERPKIMVISHERSGTHFLMNSLEKCFLYNNFINYDVPQVNINFYCKDSIIRFLRTIDNENIIVKSHHPYDFFEGILAKIPYKIIYIYRNPLDVMVSNRFLNNGFSWFECPNTKNISEFIRTIPTGRCTRYQYKAEKNFLNRWKTHVEGWLQQDVIKIKYEDLKDQYEKTINYISTNIGINPFQIIKPSKDRNVIKAKNQPDKYIEDEHKYNEEDIIFIKNEIGDFMKKTGYMI